MKLPLESLKHEQTTCLSPGGHTQVMVPYNSGLFSNKKKKIRVMMDVSQNYDAE